MKMLNPCCLTGHVTVDADKAQVDSQSKRTRAQDVASAVLNVHRVLNELQVKGQKATSSN
jgi:hypothetical protein